MKIVIAVGFILNAGVLSFIAYQQNQQITRGNTKSEVQALLKIFEEKEVDRGRALEGSGEHPLADKIDKLVALAERAEQREVEEAKAAQEPEEKE